MKFLPIALPLALLLSCGMAAAQTAPALASPAASPAVYSTSQTTVGTLLADPAAKAIVEKHFPGLTTNPQIGMASGLTLVALKQYMPDMFSDKALAETDADLAKLPMK